MIKYFSAATGYTGRTILLLLAAGLLVHLLAAWHSIGFFHFDEHYQILEFASFKAGLSPAEDLAWEYEAQIRPTIQPWIAYFAIKLHALFRPHDAFTVAGMLRVLSALLGFICSLLMAAASFKWIESQIVRKLILWMSLFLWFIVFMDARFSSESWSGIFFFSAIALLTIKESLYGNSQNQSASFIIFCGFLLGLSLVFRLQMVLVMPGLALWCLFVGRTKTSVMLWLVFGGLAGLALGFLSDYLFYGNFVNTAYRYFTINIMEGKAAEFGVSPWWFYIPEFLQKAHLPLSFVVMLLTVLAWIRYPKHILTFTCVPFILLHFAIAHKELRFLFPVAHAMPVFLGFGILFILEKVKNVHVKGTIKTISLVLLAIFSVQNFGLLAKVSTAPVNDVLESLRYIYRSSRTGTANEKVDIIIADKYDYGFLQGLPMNFYVRPHMRISRISTADSINTYLTQTQRPVYFMLRTRGHGLPENFKSLEPRLKNTEYTLPEWYAHINYNNWLNRTSFWRVYRLEPTGK